MVEFNESMKISYNYDESFFNTDSNWIVLKNLYNKNVIEVVDKKQQKIPKIIHQIWVGGEIPKEYDEIRNTWKKYHPDWEYKLWTDEDAIKMDMINRKQYDLAKNPATKSDILRYELLYKYGGLYVDTDFECIKNFDDLLYLEFFNGVSYDKNVVMYNGLIASVPKHNIIKSCIYSMTSVNDDNWMNLFNTTGVYYFSRMFLNEVENNDIGVVSFPLSYFYPLPNKDLNMDIDLIPDNVKKYIKPESYAIHQWHVSWCTNKKIFKINIQS